MTGSEWIKEQEASEAEAAQMTVDVWTGETSKVTLAIEIEDLEELIVRAGWTVTDDIQNITDEAREELRRLSEKDYTESKFGANDRQGKINWWKSRIIAS